MKTIKKIIISFIFNIKNDKFFSYAFNFLIKYSQGEKIKIVEISDSYILLEDYQGMQLSIARRNRLFTYIGGIKARFNQLANEYKLNLISFEKNDLVIDCGANIGEVGVYLSTEFGVRVYSFEPEKKEFNCLKRNFLKVSNHEKLLLNKALYNKDGYLEYFSKNDTNDSSLIEMKDYVKKNIVPVIKFSTFVKDNNIKSIKLFKLEAEGAEPEILGGIDDFSIIEYISADLGPERGLNNELTVVPVNKILTNNHFELISVSYPRMCFLYKNTKFIAHD